MILLPPFTIVAAALGILGIRYSRRTITVAASA
jgi:hypothetical protein